jgi:hypothetical protein
MLSANCSAQEILKGTVYSLEDTTITKKSGILKSANVLLLNPSDSSTVAVGVTNKQGIYILAPVKPGNYILKVVYIGYKSVTKPIKITKKDTLAQDVSLPEGNYKFPSKAETNFLKINGQGVLVYQPKDNYLLEVTQKWDSARSVLGDLRKKQMESDNIELRLWDGYGLFGTRGIILKRMSGKWTVQRVNIKTCAVYYPDSLKGIVPKKKFFAGVTTKDCNGDKFDVGISLQVDTALVSKPLKVTANLNRLWNTLVENGLLDLPTNVKHSWIMLDGRTFVVEVRVGNFYKASVLAYLKNPKLKAYKTIKNIVRILYQKIDT